MKRFFLFSGHWDGGGDNRGARACIAGFDTFEDAQTLVHALTARMILVGWWQIAEAREDGTLLLLDSNEEGE